MKKEGRGKRSRERNGKQKKEKKKKRREVEEFKTVLCNKLTARWDGHPFQGSEPNEPNERWGRVKRVAESKKAKSTPPHSGNLRK